MKIRLAQHTVDCSGDAEAAGDAWRAQGAAWIPLPGFPWSDAPAAAREGPGLAWSFATPRLGATLSLLQLVEPGPHGARIHARAELEGPMAWLHGLLLRGHLRACLPGALRGVARAVSRPPPA